MESFNTGTNIMINGAHVLRYSENPEADRAFFRYVLEFPYVHVGNGLGLQARNVRPEE